jgi:hypothetical protein
MPDQLGDYENNSQLVDLTGDGLDDWVYTSAEAHTFS